MPRLVCLIPAHTFLSPARTGLCEAKLTTRQQLPIWHFSNRDRDKCKMMETLNHEIYHLNPGLHTCFSCIWEIQNQIVVLGTNCVQGCRKTAFCVLDLRFKLIGPSAAPGKKIVCVLKLRFGCVLVHFLSYVCSHSCVLGLRFEIVAHPGYCVWHRALHVFGLHSTTHWPLYVFFKAAKPYVYR